MWFRCWGFVMLIRFFTFVLCLALMPSAANANPFVSDKVTIKTYVVDGTDLLQLRQQMKKKGPKGFWAFTKTNWKWDRHCNIKFWATITMPKLKNRSKLKPLVLAEWDRMLGVLHAHEQTHVDIGRGWAAAIKAADCDKAAVERINKEWRGKDAAYDRATQHGKLEGVTLGR